VLTHNGTQPQTGTQTYACSFNGNPVALTECGVYRYTFDSRTATPTITDPVTDEQIVWGSRPDGSNSIDPGTGPGTATSPGTQCMAEWGSAPDPVQWVLHPVKCALVWAFVPRTAVATATQLRMEDHWRGSLPGQLAEAISGIGVELDAGDCGGLVLPSPKVGPNWSVTTENHAFLAACPGDFFAPFAPGFYWLTTFSVIGVGVWGVKRYADRFVGF
jgi:hypothetical protein